MNSYLFKGKILLLKALGHCLADLWTMVWALPGGFVDYGEKTEDAAIREAKEETSIDIESVKLFNVYSDPNRDPRRHTVSIVYLAHGNFDDAKADDDAKDIGVFSFDVLKEEKLAFDHETILSDIKKHLEEN